MYRLLQLYFYKALLPMIAVLGASLIAMMVVLLCISVIERGAGQPTVFDLDLQVFGNIPPDSPSALNRGYLMPHQSRYKSCAVDMLCYLFEVSPPTAIAQGRVVLWAWPELRGA